MPASINRWMNFEYSRYVSMQVWNANSKETQLYKLKLHFKDRTLETFVALIIAVVTT